MISAEYPTKFDAAVANFSVANNYDEARAARADVTESTSSIRRRLVGGLVAATIAVGAIAEFGSAAEGTDQFYRADSAAARQGVVANQLARSNADVLQPQGK
jgi:hypothetical protein